MAVEAAATGGRSGRLRVPLRPADWSDRAPHPWRRFFARYIDIALMGWLVLVLAGLALNAILSDAGRENFRLWLQSRWLVLDLVAVNLAVLPANALVIGLTGTSPGKWIMGIGVLDREGRPLGVRRAFLRELDVCSFGLGLIVPAAGWLPMMYSSVRLTETGRTWWDALNRDVVVCRRAGVLTWLLSGLVLVLALLAAAGLRQMALRYAGA